MSIDAATYGRLREIAGQVSGYGEVEIADGQVTLGLPPTEAQQDVAHRLAAQLPSTRPTHTVHLGPALEHPGLGLLYRPDLVVAAEGEVNPSTTLLVVEVVAPSGPARDYGAKVNDYAALGIPHYLLVDPQEGTGMAHSHPGYAWRTRFTFGDTVRIGPWTLDTSALRTYGHNIA